MPDMNTCTLLRADNGLPFVPLATLVTNDDGSVSFQLPDGTFAGQTPWVLGQPSTYGLRYPDSAVCGAYQRASLSGALVTFLTRPQDIPCGYILFTGQAF